MIQLARDARHAFRNLARRPGFTLTAILILGVGIGSATTIFSVVDRVLLRQLPYPGAERLMVFTQGAHSGPDWVEWTGSLDSFDALGAAWDGAFDVSGLVTGQSTPEQVAGARVSDGFLPMFGARAVHGRLLAADDHRGDSGVVVLGEAFWRRRYGGDPEILGRAVQVEGKPKTVVGVVGAGFEPPEGLTARAVDLWFPLDLARPELRDRHIHVLSVAGRLAPGVSAESAQAEVDALRRAQAEEFPDVYTSRDGELAEVPLVPLRETQVSEVRERLEVLLGAVALLLLIACADVAILLLARGTARRREMALRGALGARPGRLVAQLLTESACLGLGGGALGALLAVFGTELFAAFQPAGLPRADDLGVDLRVLAFAVAVSLATALLFGLLPALQAAGVKTTEMLKEGGSKGSRGSGGPGGERLRGGLVVAEVALALTLLVGSGLLFRSLIERLRVDPGFDTGGLLTLALTPGTWGEDSTYTRDERARLVEDLRTGIAALPGVTSVGGGWTLPFVRTGGSRCCWRTHMRAAGASPDTEPIDLMMHPVTAGYFEALDASIPLGRAIDERDQDVPEGNVPAVVLDTETARKLFGDASPVGRIVTIEGVEPVELTVVGVVDGLRQWGLDQEVGDAAYIPYGRFGSEIPDIHFAVRTAVAPDTLAGPIRELVARLDPDLPVDEIATMDERVSRSLAGPRFLSILLGAFAGVALFLAVGGIYASMVYWVSQRRHELGIRVAVGAERSDVLRLVLGRGGALVAIGLVLGTAGALALSRAAESLVWGITPRDPATLITAAALLAVSAVAACVAPARKATRVDPVEALRAD
jgi:putative ABC transport system permease protein